MIATLLTALLIAFQSPAMTRVGRATVIYWPGEASLAVTLGEIADRSVTWPGIDAEARPIRLILAGTRQRFDSLTNGAVPSWTGGVTYPASSTIVLRVEGDPRQVLRHELAHLALRTVVPFAPRWLEEGYASRAAGEWDRFETLRVNWALLTQRPPTLTEVDRELSSRVTGSSSAEAAYAYASTAVGFLERMGGERGLAPVLHALGRGSDIDGALRQTHGITLDQFETLWRRDLIQRFGWVMFLTSFTGFWTVMGLMLVALWWWRRGRDEERRLALDEGWVVPPDDPDPSA